MEDTCTVQQIIVWNNQPDKDMGRGQNGLQMNMLKIANICASQRILTNNSPRVSTGVKIPKNDTHTHTVIRFSLKPLQTWDI